MVGVRDSLNLKRSKKFSVKKQWRPAKIASEVIELLENATPGSIKKATKYGKKIFQGKNLKTLF